MSFYIHIDKQFLSSVPMGYSIDQFLFPLLLYFNISITLVHTLFCINVGLFSFSLGLYLRIHYLDLFG